MEIQNSKEEKRPKPLTPKAGLTNDVKLFSFVDIIDGKFYYGTNPTIPECIEFGQQIGAAVPLAGIGASSAADSEAPGYVVAGTDALYICKGKEVSKYLSLTGIYESFQRSNDAKADPKGRLWFGSVSGDDDHSPSGNLYRYAGGTCTIMQPETKISNGMAWNAARTRFFFSDSPFNAVFAYDYNLEKGTISGRTPLFEVRDGVPDGMWIDTEDNLWVAVWGGHRIEKHSSVSGELLAVVEVPAKNVTSCCFYGENMDTLFITSSGNDLIGQYDGCLFTCKVDTTGCAPDYAVLL